MKRVSAYILVVFVALASGIAISIYRSPGGAPEIPEVADIPVIDHPLTDLENGATRHLREWRGKVLLVNFWATWCVPCREEIPLLQQARDHYQDKNLEVIGVAFDEAGPVRAFRDQLAIHYPLLLALDDPFTLLANSGNEVGGLPHSVLLGRNGKILASHTGVLTPDQLDELIQSHL
jgi:thiol-disulfide isomerase/thioredoxin